VLLFCLAPHQRDDSENDLVQEDQKMVEAAYPDGWIPYPQVEWKPAREMA